MSVKNTTGLVLLTIGLAILIISASADFLGIRNVDILKLGRIGDDPGFGEKQILGTIGGIITILIGSILRFTKS